MKTSGQRFVFQGASRAARWFALPLSLALATGPRAWAARTAPVEAPQMLKLRITDPYLALEYDDQSEKTHATAASDASKQSTRDLTPLAGVSFNGSLYHPSVASFSGSIEEGLTLGKRTYTYPSATPVNEDRSFQLQRYNAEMILLREKPYAVTLYGGQSQDRRDYGDFQRYTTDSKTYGTRLGYRGGIIPFSLQLGRWEENIDDPDRPTFRRESTLTLMAENHRHENDRTTANFTYNDFRQEENGIVNNQGHVTTLNASDVEFFGKDDRGRLDSSLNINELDANASNTRSLGLRENYRRKYTDHLWGNYAYTFDDNSSNGSDTKRNIIEGDLNHKLAASLDSKIGALAEADTTTGNGADQRLYRYGPRVGEVYNKKLSTWGHLRLNVGANYYRESQNNAGSTTIAVINERVQLTDGMPAILAKPDVNAASIVVTDTSGATLYLLNLDYTIVPRGNYTEIQRIFGGRIANGAAVNISYNAQAQAGAHVTTIDSDAGAELTLFKDLLTFYVTRRNVDSSGGESLTFQTYNDTIEGIRFKRGWVTLGYEHADHNATELDYTANRTYEQLAVPLYDGALLGLDASQSRTRYPNLDDTTTIDTYTARFQQQLLAALWCSLAAGWYTEKQAVTSRDVTSAEAELSWRYGKLEARATAKMETEDNSGEKRDRNWIFLRVVRRF